MNSLLLTAEEQAIFLALPEALKEGWKTEDETLTAYETPRQLQMRFHMSSLSKYPMMKSLAASVQAGKKIEVDEAFGAFSEDMIPEVFFLLGARGLSTMIASVLTSASTDDELKTVAAWSHVRNDLLQTNASIS